MLNKPILNDKKKMHCRCQTKMDIKQLNQAFLEQHKINAMTYKKHRSRGA